jgi:cation diffusion facilitator CzcD-associated flavoprotein CzcO
MLEANGRLNGAGRNFCRLRKCGEKRLALGESRREGGAVDVLIAGAGFAGLYMLIKARRMGLNAILLEAEDEVGGTWRANRYPGARVDVQSLEYSYSFDEALQQEWRWSERYASQPELLRYANHVADRFSLRDDICFNTRLTEAMWDEAHRRWSVAANTGRRWSAKFLVMACGPLSTPNMPDFEGLDGFRGQILHTARWPRESVNFDGLRVGVVGTGSSGVQVIPQIARQARELTVFQRTAAYVVPAHNGPLDPAFEARVKADYPGFRRRNRTMPTGFGCENPPNPTSALSASSQERQAMFEERWRIGGFALLGAYGDLMLDERANALAAEFVRGKIRGIVRDPDIAERLSPRQTIGCKRLCVDSSGYYETFNRQNVSLVDVSQVPIERVTRDGIVAGGREYRLDALVLATGFDAMTGTLTRLDIKGRDGLPIREKWSAGALNYLGLAVAGFPNLFNIAGAGSSSAFTSVILAIEHHVDWIGDCLNWLRGQGRDVIEATGEAEAKWVDYVRARAERTVYLSCNSWYLGANILGKPRIFMPLPVGFPVYAARCAEVAANGYEGFRVG